MDTVLTVFRCCQPKSDQKRAELKGLFTAGGMVCLPTLRCIWSVCSQAAGAVHRHAALKAAIFTYADKLQRHTHICRQSRLHPSALYPMIPADSSRRVTAGSETKLEQRKVKPSRSHVFLKVSALFFPLQASSQSSGVI